MQGERRNLARAMIVTCTSCSKRYLVDARALGASGRNVRCAGCGNTWFQATPPEAMAAALAPPAIDIEPERRERRVQLPAVKRQRRRSPLLGWALAVLVIVAGIWGLVAARGYVMSVWPPAAKLYAMVGLGPAGDLGLSIKFAVSRKDENDQPVVAVDGQVTNVSLVTRDVPKLHVALHDNDDHELQSVDVEVPDQRLLPGASVPFHATIAQPAKAATTVVVSFPGLGQ
jgi:predicted Zn finger-like uncharacterized protein